MVTTFPMRYAVSVPLTTDVGQSIYRRVSIITIYSGSISAGSAPTADPHAGR
jgi:hypothetical protein